MLFFFRVYKYVARGLFENKYYELTKTYLDKSKDTFYQDPELHFLYAKFYIYFKNYNLAEYHLKECLFYIPDYYPAKSLLTSISPYLVN